MSNALEKDIELCRAKMETYRSLLDVVTPCMVNVWIYEGLLVD